MAFFQFLSLVFYPYLPKIRHSHPNKKYLIFVISKTMAIVSQRFNVLSVICGNDRYLKMFFFIKLCLESLEQYIYYNIPWKQNKKIFSSYYVFYEYPNSLQNFRSLRIRVPEITGGGRVGLPLDKVWVQTSQYGKG